MKTMILIIAENIRMAFVFGNYNLKQIKVGELASFLIEILVYFFLQMLSIKL